MNASKPHVVIVGAGFAGLNAAKALKRAPVSVTIIDRRNHHLFQPLLYQVATAALSAGDIAYPIRAILKHQKNANVVLAEAVAVELANRKVVLSDGDVKYDYLILATGARHAYFGHEEWEDDAPGLKTLEDAIEIRRRILVAFEKAERASDPDVRKDLLTFVIVGAGPTGVELAGAIAEISRQVMVDDFRAIDPRDARIILIEAGPRILPSFPEELSDKAEKFLGERGVEVWKGSPVTHVAADSVVVNQQRVAAATTLWAAGVQASPLAGSLSSALDRAGRVSVKQDLTLPDHPKVFVVGDLAMFAHDGGKPLPGVAPVAVQQGRHAAQNVMRGCRGEDYEPFGYHDQGSLATIGRASAIADFGKIRFSGFLAWLLWLLVHVMQLIGFRNRFAVIYDWAWAYFRWYRSSRVIFGDPHRVFAGWQEVKSESGARDRNSRSDGSRTESSSLTESDDGK